MPDGNPLPQTTEEAKETIRRFVLMRFAAARNMVLSDEVSLLEAGVIDSLGIMDIINFLEETFGIQVRDQDLVRENFDNISALARFVHA
ncbi:MAG: acyl carrier protein [Candidatus Entotheonellia bacterium]